MKCPLCTNFMNQDCRVKEYNTHSCSDCYITISHDYKQIISYKIEVRLNNKVFLIVANKHSNKTGVFLSSKKIVLFEDFIPCEKVINKFKMVIAFL